MATALGQSGFYGVYYFGLMIMAWQQTDGAFRRSRGSHWPQLQILLHKSACLLVTLLAQESPGSAAATINTTNSFVVGSYNINFGNPSLSNIAAAIREAKVDLLGLQETNPQSERYLRQQFAREYPYMEFRGGTRGADGLAIISRAPLRKLRYLPPQFGMFGALIGETTLRGTNVQIAVVHLQPPDVGRLNNLAAALGLFAEMEEIHSLEIAHVHSQLLPRSPMIILGDFNSLPGGRAPKFLLDHGLVDTFASATNQPDDQVTWHWKTPNREWRLRLDYLFHSAAMISRNSRVIRSDASDHYLIVSRLWWAKEMKKGQ